MTHRVDLTYERTVTFFVEAESEEAVKDFLDKQDAEWRPADVPGLIDFVSDEKEVGYTIETDEEVSPCFAIDELGRLVELE